MLFYYQAKNISQTVCRDAAGSPRLAGYHYTIGGCQALSKAGSYYKRASLNVTLSAANEHLFSIMLIQNDRISFLSDGEKIEDCSFLIF